ncbi:MAG: hypothetical protein L6R36_006628 [Xanthoria steineri]|nr:MAG: hypothetical protein L6R36_006628 [Xanthoria steineri]
MYNPSPLPSSPISTSTGRNQTFPLNPPGSSLIMALSNLRPTLIFDIICHHYFQSRDEAPTRSPHPHPHPENLFSLTRPRPDLEASILSSSLTESEANIRAFRNLIILVNERATFFETQYLKASESLHTTSNTILTPLETRAPHLDATGIEDQGHEAVTQKSNNGSDVDEKAGDDQSIESELKQWSGDMVLLGNLCRKWQDNVFDATIEAISRESRLFGPR